MSLLCLINLSEKKLEEIYDINTIYIPLIGCLKKIIIS